MQWKPQSVICNPEWTKADVEQNHCTRTSGHSKTDARVMHRWMHEPFDHPPPALKRRRPEEVHNWARPAVWSCTVSLILEFVIGLGQGTGRRGSSGTRTDRSGLHIRFLHCNHRGRRGFTPSQSGPLEALALRPGSGRRSRDRVVWAFQKFGIAGWDSSLRWLQETRNGPTGGTACGNPLRASGQFLASSPQAVNTSTACYFWGKEIGYGHNPRDCLVQELACGGLSV